MSAEQCGPPIPTFPDGSHLSYSAWLSALILHINFFLLQLTIDSQTVKSKVDSFYRWQAKIHDHNEYTLTVKTIEAYFSKIEELIKREHTYDIPQIICSTSRTARATIFDG